jgi:transcriptional regulator with XRE-family HTH domain
MDNIYIRKRREYLRIGLREFADKINVSPTYISLVERNLTKPTPEMLKEICRTLELDYYESCRLSRVFPEELKEQFFQQKERD